MVPNILSIAGSDPSAGAGIQADLKTISALKGYGTTVVTLLTAQNTQGVKRAYTVPAHFVADQLESLRVDMCFDAIKLGVLGCHETVNVLADWLLAYKKVPLVLDPVMIANSGDVLTSTTLMSTAVTRLFPLSTLITPNLDEAATLLGCKVANDVQAMKAQVSKLHALGASKVLLKGGHLEGNACIDVYFDGRDCLLFEEPRVDTVCTHGTGCTLASAIATFLGHGKSMEQAIGAAKTYLTQALVQAKDLNVGQGQGPVHHFCRCW